jgi:hypothetical protein
VITTSELASTIYRKNCVQYRSESVQSCSRLHVGQKSAAPVSAHHTLHYDEVSVGACTANLGRQVLHMRVFRVAVCCCRALLTFFRQLRYPAVQSGAVRSACLLSERHVWIRSLATIEMHAGPLTFDGHIPTILPKLTHGRTISSDSGHRVDTSHCKADQHLLGVQGLEGCNSSGETPD